MKKVLFTLSIDNAIDIITNSSSELFVLKADSQEIVKDLITKIYPDYENEYEEPIALRSLPEERIEDYLTWVYNLCGPKEGRWGSKKLHIFKFSSFEDMYEVASWSSPNRQEEEYQLKKGFIENNLQQILDEIDPNSKLFLMYSIDENPNWDMQEKLMNIATRYHLG